MHSYTHIRIFTPMCACAHMRYSFILFELCKFYLTNTYIICVQKQIPSIYIIKIREFDAKSSLRFLLVSFLSFFFFAIFRLILLCYFVSF